jgi:hypothetical protein
VADILSEGDEVATAGKSHEDILSEARERLALAEEAESDIRRLALEDLEFRSGKQWPDNIQQDRNRDGRPCLVINRLPQFIQQVTNDQRQNRPAIKVHPVNDAASVETARVIQGMIRHIEYNSNAEIAYDTAFEGAAIGGFGYWRITTDYLGPESFDQEIYIKRIRNPFSVYFDPYAQEPDGSDANWAFVVEDLSPDEYRSRYPESELATAGIAGSAIGDRAPAWVKSDNCRVAEYFYKESKDVLIHLLSTGDSVTNDKLDARLFAAQEAGIKCEVVRSRRSKMPFIKWVKMNGIEILEETEWLGIYIPIVPVYGAELYVNGKRILESVIRNAKDSQRMYNYWASAETEAIALAPRAPYLIAEGQLEGHEEQWESANRRNHPYLSYKPTTVSGQPASPPQRQSFEPAVQAITNARMVAADDLKATTGIYDAALGNKSPDTSGIAIQRRNTQAQTSNFHFVDNLTRSLRHTGRILVDLIPKIYDTTRAMRIIGDDGEQKIVTINSEHTDDSGKKVLYSLEAGRYDVTVDTGPNFASKRQEAAASMLDLSRAYPQIMQVAGDLFVKNMDWPGAQEISERLKKTLPPGIADDPKGAKALPPQIQAQMQQQMMMIKSLSEHLNETTKILETKKLDIEHRERVEFAKIQADIEMKLAELASKGHTELLKQEVETLRHESSQITKRLNLIGINEPIEAPNNFDPQQADGGNYAGMGHVGGTANVTGGDSPGSPMEGI